MTHIPGLGVATTVDDLASKWSDAAEFMRQMAEEYPNAVAVRNQAGNLSFVLPGASREEDFYMGWIDVMTGEFKPVPIHAWIERGRVSE